MNKIIELSKLVGVVLPSILFSACVIGPKPNQSDQNSVNAEVLVPKLVVASNAYVKEAIPTLDDLFALSEKNLEQFNHYFNQPYNAIYKPQERVANYIDTFSEKFVYKEKTFTADYSLSQKTGNCMSLAALTMALAESVGLDVSFQLLARMANFDIQNQYMIRSDHVRTKLSNTTRIDTGIRRSGIYIDFFAQKDLKFDRHISKQQFIGMFYRNLASEAIVKGELNYGYNLLVESIEYFPEDPNSYSMLGMLLKRSKEFTEAKNVFDFAFDHTYNPLGLVDNYRLLLSELNEKPEHNKKLLSIKSSDYAGPASLYNFAKKAYDDKNYRLSLKYLQQTNELAPNIQQVHLSLAKVHRELGNEKNYNKFLLSAAKLSDLDDLDKPFKDQIKYMKYQIR